MNAFQKRIAIRIAAVSILLAAIAGPVSWWVARELAGETILAMAREESHQLLRRHQPFTLTGPQAAEHAAVAVQAISSGLFDIAEIYDRQGRKLADSTTDAGAVVEAALPEHGPPEDAVSWQQNLELPGGPSILRVFVPLRASIADRGGSVTGYFEGIRIVPEWQRRQIFNSSLIVASMVCLASLLCGAALYPVVVHISADNERKARELLDSHLSMMEALGRTIAKRDSDTGDHNYRVAWISIRISEQMGLGGSDMQALIAGSFLHDVGKIAIPDAILLKPGKLDDRELLIMRSHVEQGEEVVSGIGWLTGANAVVAAHHEKWDGSGYPRRLKGHDIPLLARIFAVADVFDALCSRRRYKEPLAFDATMEILERDTGSHFDPSVMAVFRPMAPDIFDFLAHNTASESRQLLQDRVRLHFAIPGAVVSG